MLILLLIILLFFIIVVFLLAPKRNELSQEINESYETLDELNYLINQKQNELNDLPNNSTNYFTHTQNKALDVYDNSNIRIPLDILEDLASQNLKTEKEIFDFIENQRNYWKLENQKKPYKKTTL